MGRKLRAAGERVGPRIWARYLKARFSVKALAPLNAQLALPIVPFETFIFGHEPAPLPLRLAPRFFESAYELGRSPNGMYWPELHSPDGVDKFNLFERVSSRVPGSSKWLLEDLSPYLGEPCPQIEASRILVDHTLGEMGAFALSVPAVAALLLLDEESLTDGAVATMSGLLTPIPECLSLAYGLYHLAVWHSLHLGCTSIIRDLDETCALAGCTFRNGLVSLGLDDGKELGEELIECLRKGAANISRNGARSMGNPGTSQPLELAIRLVLVADTPRTKLAAKHLDSLGQIVLERSYPYQVKAAFYSWGLTTTEAIDEILMGCADLIDQLHLRWDQELNRTPPTAQSRRVQPWRNLSTDAAEPFMRPSST